MLAVTGRMAYLLRIWLITSDFLGSNPNSIIQLSCCLVNYCSQMFFFLTVKGLSFPTWLALGLATWHALANKMWTGICFHIWIEMLRSTAYWVTDHFFFFFYFCHENIMPLIEAALLFMGQHGLESGSHYEGCLT